MSPTLEVCSDLPYFPKYRHCGYIRPVLEIDLLTANIREACDALSAFDFQSIAFRGMSGALVAPSIAVAMHKTLIMVRKPGDDNHGRWSVEGDANAERYVIVDDLIETGSTALEIVKQVAGFAPQAKCIGVLEICELSHWNGELSPVPAQVYFDRYEYAADQLRRKVACQEKKPSLPLKNQESYALSAGEPYKLALMPPGCETQTAKATSI